MLGQVLQAQLALALGRAAPAQAQEPRQASIGRAVRGQKDDRLSIERMNFGADQELQP